MKTQDLFCVITFLAIKAANDSDLSLSVTLKTCCYPIPLQNVDSQPSISAFALQQYFKFYSPLDR